MSRRRRAFTPPRIIAIALAFGGVGIIGAYLTLFFGLIHGQEFSPDLFQRRDFEYHEIPLIRLKITGIVRSDSTGNLEAYLLGEKIVTKSVKPNNARWDLVEAFKGPATENSTAVIRGDALILCRYLDARDNKNNEVWLKWTKKHRPLAKQFWPVIAELARQQLYIFIPDMFAIAREEQNPDKLQKRIDETLAEKYLFLGHCQQQLEKHHEAVELFDQALQHDSDLVGAQEGRAESLAALKTQDKVETD